VSGADDPDPDEIVRASGTLTWRAAPSGRLELLVVHSARYGDWSWPKGKPEGGETAPQCAVREVAEESGVTVRLGRALPGIAYVLPDGRRKRVRFWAARAVTEGARTASAEEIDDVAWVPADELPGLLTRPGDARPLATLLHLWERGRLDSRALVVVRHAKAVPRRKWDGAEPDRPLTADGERQARALVGLLAAWRPDVLLTSPWARCRQTLEPYAEVDGDDLLDAPELTEDGALEEPEAAASAVKRLAAAGDDLALCTHRPVLPAVLGAVADLSTAKARNRLPRKDPWLAKAELLVGHVTQESGGPVIRAVERHRAK
jgi:8-oxo-dGTP pyrophosphatase MutT (NUDIX family)/phosphohistidine phosphatase SixA